MKEKFNKLTCGEWIKLDHDFDNDVEDCPKVLDGDTFLVAIKLRSPKSEAHIWKFQTIRMINGRLMEMESGKILRPWQESWMDVSQYCWINEEFDGEIKHALEEDIRIKFNIPKREKGLVFKIAIDAQNGGFHYIFNKNRFELLLWFIAIRIYFMNETHENFLNTVANFDKFCSSHSTNLKEIIKASKNDK